DHLLQIPGIEVFAPRTARRWKAVVAVRIQPREEMPVDPPAAGDLSVGVVTHRSPARPPGRGIDQRASRTDVVGGHDLATVDHREVRDAAEVNGGARPRPT